MNRRQFLILGAPVVFIVALVAGWLLYLRSGVPDPASLSPSYHFGSIDIAPVALTGDDATAIAQMTGGTIW